jgi:bacteriocin biosynthesis cyclodehydratase domain-containing protein
MLIFTAGHFGQALGARMAASHGATCVDLLASAGQFDQLVEDASFVAVASWRAHPALCRELDDACFRHGVRWSMVQLDGDVLTCGPLVQPGKGACHHCYQSRAAAHSAALKWERELQAYYELNPEQGPAGYPAALLEIGAASLADDVLAVDAGARVRTIDVISSSVRESEVIGIHRCPRCRSRGPNDNPADCTVDILVPQLESILS